ALAAVQQGEFAEDIPRPERADDLLSAIVCSLAHLRRARDDHEELVGAISLKEDHCVRFEALSLGDPAELLELCGPGPLEDTYLRELFHEAGSARAETPPTGSARPSGALIARTARKVSTATAAPLVGIRRCSTFGRPVRCAWRQAPLQTQSGPT